MECCYSNNASLETICQITLTELTGSGKGTTPKQQKRGGVCIYYNESLGVRITDIPNLIETVFIKLQQITEQVMFL